MSAMERARERIVEDEARKVNSVDPQTVLSFVLFKIHLRMLRNRNLICLKMGSRLKVYFL